jgi:DNA adenine methylase
MKPRSAPRYPSPLRYPGGKGKVANYVKLLLIENGLVGAEYIEPFAGGAGVALSLLYEGLASRIHINDLDPDIYAFWRTVLTDPEELCRRIDSVDVTMDEWHRQREVLEADTVDRIDLAFATFFLNRTNRSGIIRGGVIGGKQQAGEWKLHARYNKPALIRRIELIAEHRERINLTCLDAAIYVDTVLPTLPDRALVYLDPPYFVKGQGLYRNAYSPDDHAEIAGLVPNIRQRWLVSYDAAPEIIELYKGHTPLRYDLSYSAQSKYMGREVMFYSPGLKRPRVESPANIRGLEVRNALSPSLLFKMSTGDKEGRVLCEA